ncbi:helix-turn-helix domain-containing protein [uncultured Trichococcus sp.]|uniref:helix-turn-helix transcriptional regulator n=1 Tax=uncultured Trichococcus sp. TaxID=189665 RepID=UPI0029C8C31C|nr:helix-turn-helix domain-containing protein [uncultured Trichococcus sp.]
MMIEAKARTKVKGYRVMLGITQEELAKNFGISKQAYSAKERGLTRFTNKEMIAIKELLLPLFPGITIDEIFF